ncbi:hypothetical protein Ccrd_025134 [Cynara cardunculus var. scolymus]|uniref:Uncharacterized protein n=1 Tax=Cynara cardunculus var. scolymus TaxID=59895 RepID=A0A103XBC1_CYNCS|nr:hypothetical protein Ccrd_025134 [Cynara cardunculus var. scolymus]
MRGGGVGGPLLCIGDLLSDVGEEDTTTSNEFIHNSHRPSFFGTADFTNQHIQSSDLTKLYQLCLALETGNKLIQSSISQVTGLSKKIRELERITNKGNLVIKEAEFIHSTTTLEGSI